jgi:hypothetical protein
MTEYLSSKENKSVKEYGGRAEENIEGGKTEEENGR